MSTSALAEPKISFDPALPISARADEIETAIRHHQVVVVAGETGSGKTTQLPKICLRLGRRSIGHTQPRRIAARTVAERIAEELDVPLGELVGYQVRFTRKAGRDTRLKVMTDGVLLAEIGHDRELRKYDTIIIDEAHERSLNIDFLLGYLKQLLPRRPELKVIITSATIDTLRFAEHFTDRNGHPAPIVEVSGRTYPVETRYRPLVGQAGEGAGTAQAEDLDQVDGIVRAARELMAEGDGDILVFLSGEREIRDAADALHQAQVAGAREFRFTEVLPLYARLSAAEQHKVFQSHTGRRIVLATNVAETSLTVPGIRYVIDTGTARISRYSARTKVQRLPIEPISQASANQRAGRCGRLGPGICIRLFAEEDFAGRPEFTEPEILRTNLASVILQMAAADLGDIASFPFVEAPDSAQITEGLRVLDELGAIKPRRATDRSPRLTRIGQRLAGIPIDPRMGRMLLAGERQGCLREMLIIVSGLSVQDPRERPADKQQQADQLHRRFWAPIATDDDQEPEPDGSDFIAILRLWRYLRQQQKALSGNAFRRMCRDEFLHFLRIREWQDLHAQLRQITRELGLGLNDEPADHGRIHTAILTGLLSHVGLAEVMEDRRRPNQSGRQGRRGRRELQEYLGARNTRFAINPGSSVARTTPPLVMAAEIVETTRLWARTVAGIEARQIEEVGGHLLKHSYSEPHWSARSGSVMAYEQVSLYGVPIIGRRRVAYGKINPAEAREIFIRSALVEGDWKTRQRFFAENQKVRAEAEELEDRTRRRDLLVDDQVIFDFYNARIPADVTSAAHFDKWWKDARQKDPDRLTLTLDDLVVDPDAARIDEFPDVWTSGDVSFEIGYSFQPGTARDGVSIEIPVGLLNRVSEADFSWQVPGLRTELATELIRSLSKSVRRAFVPAPEHAQRALAWLDDHRGPTGESFTSALGRALTALTGVPVPADAWLSSQPPAHLLPTYLITDRGRVLGEGKDLDELRQWLAPQVSRTLNRAAATVTVTGATDWTFGELADRIETAAAAGHSLVSFPGLADEQTSVGVKVYESAELRDHYHPLGLRRLVMINIPDPTKWVVAHLGNQAKLALGGSPYPGVPALLADARLASVGELIRRHDHDGAGSRTRDQRAFRGLCDLVRADHADRMRSLVNETAVALELWSQANAQLDVVRGVDDLAAADLREQLDNLIFPGFLAVTDGERLPDLGRYLRAALNRITVLRANPARDSAGLATVTRVEDAYAELVAALPDGPLPPDVDAIGWMLEELRVSLFAQQLRTRMPVSEKRVMTAIAEARRSHGL
ncbi:ATP-dependent RNA helicase HrpA [Microlunatus sp. Gsoil 973]|uniref:ATP-dependent RNA helicase HrpA n=1 Tax=Microlunatus sp. Gsoil 973 TaxID=2672569 RepID=UPI0012B48FC6|nr:ATP-dependent RNA helicase HrpA [Microlunatus sp. Gsoil 973]QGN32993.1 ATP-dependent RNA helicase HrpA [Microlunatus sp. Gsoil 973]